MPDAAVDVLVVGGGPAGLYAAERLARAGFHVVVCEEHRALGEPVHCTGILAAESFDEFDLPRDAALNTLSAARFVSPSGITVDYETPAPLATVIDRGVFDRRLAERAEAAGVQIRTGVRISALDAGAGSVTVVAGGAPIGARLAILACGASYAFQRRLGLGLPKAYLQTA